jgi:uncharacterized protein (TIGR02284 family)
MEKLTNMKKETLDGLQHLIEFNLDSADVLEAAAKRVDAAPYARLFRQISGERRRQAEELQSYVCVNAEEPKTKGTAAGSIRKVWVDFRSALNGGDNYVVMIEAERSEDRILEKYEDVLNKTAGSPVNDVLMRHLRAVKGWHDQVRRLRDDIKQVKKV